MKESRDPWKQTGQGIRFYIAGIRMNMADLLNERRYVLTLGEAAQWELFQ